MTQRARQLSKQFLTPDAFEEQEDASYTLLPFHFARLDAQRYILTNLAAEYCVVTCDTLRRLITKHLARDSAVFDQLKSRHFLMDKTSFIALPLLATKYRTKQLALSEFTSLHIFVPTLRCNQECEYCQVSSVSPDEVAYDMSTDVADASIDFMFRSPSSALKIEFQGGEPLLSFGVVKHIIQAVEGRARTEGRAVEFVICTNLTLITDEIIRFCRDHDVYFSTSLDGPEDLHNANRELRRGNSYQRTIAGIHRVRNALGPDRISALMTTTRVSLHRPIEIIDEYLRHGFRSAFLRPINPYGLAATPSPNTGYEIDEWLEFYREALAYIIRLNLDGVSFREEYAALILRKMLTPYGTSFVDLRSPAGIGIGVVVYNYDGALYASDESRMLAEKGDYTFRMGYILEDGYEDMMLSNVLLDPLRNSMAESVPGCSDCGVQCYCGSDPVRHYRVQGDPVGHKPTSEFCRKNMEIIRDLVHLLEDDAAAASVLRSWV